MRNKGNILLPILIVTAIILFVGVIILQGARPKVTTPVSTPTYSTDPMIQKLTQQGSSDDVASIEKDINDTDFVDLDTELTDIDRELSSN